MIILNCLMGKLFTLEFWLNLRVLQEKFNHQNVIFHFHTTIHPLHMCINHSGLLTIMGKEFLSNMYRAKVYNVYLLSNHY